MKLSATIFFLLTKLSSFSQTQGDLKLIREKNFSLDENHSSINTTKAIALHHRNFFSRYNPVSLSLTGTMLFYQHVVSPQFQASCLYERSCSNFSKEAIHQFGIIKGVFLSADRLMRCNHACEREISFLDERENGKYTDEPAKYFFRK